MEKMEKTVINFRIEKELKKGMEETCRKMGINMTTAFCQFCRKVVREQKISFDFKEEN